MNINKYTRKHHCLDCGVVIKISPMLKDNPPKQCQSCWATNTEEGREWVYRNNPATQETRIYEDHPDYIDEGQEIL
jgi:hypothetical protein